LRIVVTRHRLGTAAVAMAALAASCSGSVDPEMMAPGTPTAVAARSPTVTPVPTPPASPTPSPLPQPATPLPIDPAITSGALDNGLTYYVRENDSPGGQAELRLVVNAGSVLEDDDQSGVAHFLEHMLFNGTEAYPRNKLIDVLAGFGSEFGPEVNAFTSFDETVYELSVRADPEIVALGLGVLREWASRATLATDDVVAERGVVLDEWRTRAQGASGRQQQAVLDLVLTDSPYAGRDPIGTADVITAMTPGVLRRFYEDWYRADLMAVVVVGDVDGAAVVELITEQFADLAPAPADARPRPDPGLSAGTEVRATVLADEEVPAPSALLSFAGPATPETTVETYQDGILVGLAYDVINDRFADDVTRGDAPFLGAGIGPFPFVRGAGGAALGFDAPAGAIAESLGAVLVEPERVRRLGMNPDELARAVSAQRTAVTQTVASAATIQDGAFAEELVGHFLTGSQLLSVADFERLQTEALDAATPATVQAALNHALDGRLPAIFVTGPADADLPTPAEIADIYTEVTGGDVAPRAGEAATIDELLAPPAPVAPIASESIEPYDATILRYPNGATVVLAASDIAEDGVSLLAVSQGGTSLVDPDLVTATLVGVDAASQSGVGGFDRVAVDRFLADRAVGISLAIDTTTEQISGEARTEDLAILLQLVHLMIADPQVDPAALANVQARLAPILERPEQLPSLATAAELQALRYGDDPRLSPIPDLGRLQELDAATADAAVTARFADGGDFVFVLVGDMDIADATSLANTYLATLPADGGTPETAADIDPGPPPGVSTATVAAGQDDQGVLTRVYTAPVAVDPARQRQLDLLEVIVSSRLRDTIREELGATYSPRLQLEVTREPVPLVEPVITVTGDPAGLDEIAAALDAILADLTTTGPGAAELAAAHQQVRRDYELISNGYLLETLHYLVTHPEVDRGEERRRIAALDAVTAADLTATAATIFPADRYIEVRTVPA
jgi:zinc protease